MPKELTRKEYLIAVAEPKPRFQELTLDRSRVVQLRKRVLAPCYWFQRNEISEEDGRYAVDPSQATISLVVDGATSVLFYLLGSRIDTCTFAFNLTPAQLGRAVTAMKRAKLTRLIPAAASYALENIPEQRRGVLESELRKLVLPRPKQNARSKT